MRQLASQRLHGVLVLALAGGSAACGNGEDLAEEIREAESEVATDVEIEGESLRYSKEPDRYSVLTEDGKAKLALTEHTVYLALSDETLAKVDRKLEEKVDQKEGLGGIIASAVKAGVSQGLRFRVAYELSEVRDIRYEDGEVVFDFQDPGRKQPSMMVEDDRVTRQFREKDARAFIEAFRKNRR